MKVLRPDYRGRNSKVYHTRDCRYARRLKKEGRTEMVDKELLDSWGWTECKVCAGKFVQNVNDGPRLSDILSRMDPDEIGRKA